ncbi:MAG: MIP/aquaporin family protein [Leadbetterella sp.]
MEKSLFLGEFLGSFILMFLGNGVVANVLLSKTKGQNSGLIIITTAWGLAVTMGVFVAQRFGSAGAHINPAITIGLAFDSGEWSDVGTYILAQFLGGGLGALCVWLFYYPHYEATEDKGLKLATFSTGPAINHLPSNFFGEFMGTAILFIGVKSIVAEADTGVGPYLVGMLVFVIGNGLGGTTGYAINPMRDLAPRIMHAILPIAGKGDSNWSYAWIPVVAPILGAVAASLLF